MATINNIYVFVTDENINRSAKVPQHPVEKGLPITDNVRAEPKTLSIRGKVVNTSKLKADAIVSKLDALKDKGSLVKYIGRNVVGNYLITSFNTSHPKGVWGGAEFNMELVETKIAKSSLDIALIQQQSYEKLHPKLEKGALVVFKGGGVYVSSDAKKRASTQGRQTCIITRISTQPWSIHQYHLIGKGTKYPNKVYGWVDKDRIEGVVTSGTAAVTNGGTQQVTETDGR